MNLTKYWNILNQNEINTEKITNHNEINAENITNKNAIYTEIFTKHNEINTENITNQNTRRYPLRIFFFNFGISFQFLSTPLNQTVL